MTADAVGGVWTYALELARALPARVTVAVMGGRPSAAQRLEAEGVDVRAAEYALEWMPDPWEDLERAGEWLLELRDELCPDLVHLNGYAHAALPWRVPVLVVAHSDVLSWHEAVHGRAAGAEWDRYRRTVGEGLAAADALVAPTAAMFDTLARHYELPMRRQVIPNGRRPLSPACKEPLLVCAGRLWDEAKNVAAVERVAPRLPWPLELASGDRSPAEVAALFGRASIFVSPALYEPFGLAALEAASAGCALVLSDIPSLREVWGAAAVFVDPTEDDVLERALRRLIEDAGCRLDMAARARVRARAYTPERMAAAYAGLYGRLRSRERVA